MSRLREKKLIKKSITAKKFDKSHINKNIKSCGVIHVTVSIIRRSSLAEVGGIIKDKCDTPSPVSLHDGTSNTSTDSEDNK